MSFTDIQDSYVVSVANLDFTIRIIEMFSIALTSIYNSSLFMLSLLYLDLLCMNMLLIFNKFILLYIISTGGCSLRWVLPFFDCAILPNWEPY